MPRGVQRINGVEYVYEYDSTWNANKKYGTHKRNYIGKMIDGVFVPNKKYSLQQELELEKNKSPGPVATTQCKRSFYGATYLLDAIGEILGIVDDLKQCFPDTYLQVLSIAYYLIMEDRNPLSRFPKWASTHIHPFGYNIPSQRSSELFGSIHEDGKQNFFLKQSKRRLEKEFLAYDTTSVSSYSKSLKQVKYGINKEHDPLPQLNLALLFGENSRLPVYYRKLLGNLSDVKTIQNLLAGIDFLKIDKVKFVMDRGFYSENNINALYQKHYKFLIATKTSLKFVQKALNEVSDTMVSRPHYSSKYKLYYHSRMIDWSYSASKNRRGEVVRGERRMYLHLFYNDQKATDDKIEFNDLLDTLEMELLSKKRNPEHEKPYAKYYEIKETLVRGMTLIHKQEAIDAVKDPIEALGIYRSKDVIEKAFGNLKERLNMRRTSVPSSENLEGKLFVQFIALIYLSYIKKAMSENDLHKNYTTQELLDELDVIERYEQPGKKHRLGEMTKKQAALYTALGVTPPS